MLTLNGRPVKIPRIVGGQTGCWSLGEVLKINGQALIRLDDQMRNLEKLAEPMRSIPPPPMPGAFADLMASGLSSTSPTPLPSLLQSNPSATDTAAFNFKFAEHIAAEMARFEIVAKGLQLKRTLSQIGHIKERLEEDAARINQWEDEQLQYDLRFLR
jgi:hypothetical protein